MKLKSLAAGLALAVAAGSSAAATFNLGALGPPGAALFGNTFGSAQTFSDTFNFTLSSAADSFGITWESDLFSRRDVELNSVSLSGGSLLGTETDTTPDFFSFSNLLAGNYQLVVNGEVSGRSGGLFSSGYRGVLVTTGSAPVAAPVPEPETLAMLALGLGAVGFASRRRKKN